MKTSLTLATLIALFLVAQAGHAEGQVNLSGTWTLDKDKSFSNGPEFDQTMTIVQSGAASDAKIKLDAKQKTPRGEVAISEEYLIDGKEADFTPQSPPDAKGRRKASWLANGRGVLVEDQIDDGKAPRRVARKMTLSADGKVLTVDLFIDDSRNSYELKRVYIRVG
jgi:hypothetical protein